MHIISPCKDCKERVFKCHATCEKYHAWKKEVDAERAYFHKESESKDITYHGKTRI